MVRMKKARMDGLYLLLLGSAVFLFLILLWNASLVSRGSISMWFTTARGAFFIIPIRTTKATYCAHTGTKAESARQSPRETFML